MEIRYTLSGELLVALRKCTLGKQGDLFPELGQTHIYKRETGKIFSSTCMLPQPT